MQASRVLFRRTMPNLSVQVEPENRCLLRCELEYGLELAFVNRFGIDVADSLTRKLSASVRPVKASEISEPVEDREESQNAQPRDISELPKAITSLHIRSIALTGIFLLLALYTLKLASAFFIPVVLAIFFGRRFLSGRRFVPMDTTHG